MRFPKVKQQRKKSIIAAEALLHVLYQQYKVGEKLPPERLLAEEMGISRSTLREAVAALQLMGFLQVRHSLGNFVVSLPEQADLRDKLETILSPDSDPLGIVDTRIALEPGIARLAAERFTPGDVKKLGSHLKMIIDGLQSGDRVQYANGDKSFHLCIAEGTKNERLVQIMRPLVEELSSPLWKAMKMSISEEEMKSVRIREHQMIYEAIRDKDPEQASHHVLAHLQSSKERFLLEADQAPSRPRA